MKGYPIFLNMQQRSCVVIGGGAVAERKVRGVLAAGANVTVISPTLTAGLQKLLAEGRIQNIARSYQTGDLAGYDLAFVATNDGAVNDAIYTEAKSRRVWINSADDPLHCDFFLPARLDRDSVSIAISTGGAAPALARAIREDLESYCDEHYAELAGLVAEVRRELQSQSLRVTPEHWNRALKGPVRDLLREGARQQAKKRLLQDLGVNP